MRRSCMELSVEIWLELLDEADALPDSKRPYEKMDGERQAGWLMFRDWLEEHGKDDLVRLADRVIEPHATQDGWMAHLHPATDPADEFRWWMLSWVKTISCDVSAHLTGHPCEREVFPTALAAWKWLFARVEEKGFLPARAEVGAA